MFNSSDTSREVSYRWMEWEGGFRDLAAMADVHWSLPKDSAASPQQAFANLTAHKNAKVRN